MLLDVLHGKITLREEGCHTFLAEMLDQPFSKTQMCFIVLAHRIADQPPCCGGSTAAQCISMLVTDGCIDGPNCAAVEDAFGKPAIVLLYTGHQVIDVTNVAPC